MFELPRSEEVNKLIAITKSNSKISGPELAKAHVRLGELMGEHISLPADETTIVAVLRGGLFFAMGMYFKLGCKFETYDPKLEEFERPNTKYVIVVDSVINSGKTILKISTPDMIVACCVINEKAVKLFEPQLYTVRVSENCFFGSCVEQQNGNIGPDTTMRLFNQI